DPALRRRPLEVVHSDAQSRLHIGVIAVGHEIAGMDGGVGVEPDLREIEPEPIDGALADVVWDGLAIEEPVGIGEADPGATDANERAVLGVAPGAVVLQAALICRAARAS